MNVTKSYLPPIEEYVSYLNKIWDNNWLTNEGPLNKELCEKLKNFLKNDNFSYLNNGTIAILLALKTLELENCDILTTPFTFIATSNSIVWQHCNPIFVDIEETTFNIDPKKIEERITENTKAILAVHVFGFPCNIEEIDKIAKKHNLKVIYDAAHAFGVEYNGKSLLSYGDISTCSFHATKVFHTVEGGCCVTKDSKLLEKIELLKKFGYEGDNYQEIGINAKNSEFHAAMGLAVLNHINEIFDKRKNSSNLYTKYLSEKIYKPIEKVICDKYNYIYYPVLFESEKQLLNCFTKLNEENIYPRRYFYPSLNTLPLFNGNSCPISENVSSRIACLPLDPYITEEDVIKICKIINDSI